MKPGPCSRLFLASALALGLPGRAAPAVDTYRIDPVRSSVQFQVPRMLYSTLWVISKAGGRFTRIQGTLQVDREDVTRSKVEAVIDAASIATSYPSRDLELIGADFFDVAHHPAITFRSSSVTEVARGRLAVAGTLMLHGVARPVVIEVSGWEAGPARAGFRKGTLRLDRTDYGINTVIGPGPACNQVEITLSLEAGRVLP